jgi:hypothetical protein
MLRRLSGARAIAFAIAIPAMAVASPGCESPTLPLPPPALPAVAPGPDANHVKLVSTCGGAEPNAVIVIVNSSPAVPPDEAVGGSISNGCGAWDAVVYAHVGDYLEITQEYGTTRSTPIDVPVLSP